MLHDAVTPTTRWALFLDVDGTLLELAETPEQVYVPERLKSLLSEVAERMDGAVALVSGRTIDNLDELFTPLKLRASGVHGAERRDASGRIVRAQVDTSKLQSVRDELAGFAAAHEGLLLEDKSFAIALHYRLAPQMQEKALATVTSILDRLGHEYVLQTGKCVYEIRPRAWTKGTAVRAFLSESPFAERVPIYIGDDVTDEHAFDVVNELGGMSVRVGDAAATLARFRLPRIADVHEWLHSLPLPAPLARAS
jgi:trehalose 6-phosphate phosphatase